MGKHSAPRRRKPKWWRRHKTTILLFALLLIAGTILTVLVLDHNPYRDFLQEAKVPFLDCDTKGDTLSVTLSGDEEGVLICRRTLNLLRASENPPENLHWIFTENDTVLSEGTVEHLTYLPTPTSPRVETLEEDLTVLKLKYELEQSGLSAAVAADSDEGLDGKAISVTVETSQDKVKNVLVTLSAAVNAVNEEGGGIGRYNVLFTQDGALFAAASLDLTYGDTLYSSFFNQP